MFGRKGESLQITIDGRSITTPCTWYIILIKEALLWRGVLKYLQRCHNVEIVALYLYLVSARVRKWKGLIRP